VHIKAFGDLNDCALTLHPQALWDEFKYSYSLGRVQMILWSVVVLLSFVYILIATGE
jgi:hypothetical protein